MSAIHTTPFPSHAVEPTPEASNPQNPWLTLFDELDQVPKDENWHQFIALLHERPMNRFSVDRELFVNKL